MGGFEEMMLAGEAMELAVDPDAYEFDDIDSAADTLRPAIDVRVFGYERRALDVPSLIMLMLSYAALRFLEGFIKKAGADTWDAFSARLANILPRTRKSDTPHLNVVLWPGEPVDIVVSVASRDRKALKDFLLQAPLIMASMAQQVREGRAPSNLTDVMIQFHPDTASFTARGLSLNDGTEYIYLFSEDKWQLLKSRTGDSSEETS